MKMGHVIPTSKICLEQDLNSQCYTLITVTDWTMLGGKGHHVCT